MTVLPGVAAIVALTVCPADPVGMRLPDVTEMAPLKLAGMVPVQVNTLPLVGIWK